MAFRIRVVSLLIMFVGGQTFTVDPTDESFTTKNLDLFDNSTTADPHQPAPPPRRKPVCNMVVFILPEDHPQSLSREYTIWRGFNNYRWAVVNSIGVTGNAIAFIGNIKKARTSSPQLYMTVLAVIDSMYLALSEAFHYLPINLKIKFGVAGCKIMMFFITVVTSVSTWLVIIMTVERVIVVRFPLKASGLCTYNRAVKSVVGLIMACIVTSLPILELANYFESAPACGYTAGHVLTKFDVIFHSIFLIYLPIIILFVCNIIIILTVKTSAAMKRGMAGSEASPGGGGQERQVTIMLLLVSVTFFLLMIPPLIMRYVMTYTYTELMYEYTCYRLIITMFMEVLKGYIIALNYCVNGYLYCLASATFRRDFLAMICPCRRGTSIATSVATASSRISTISKASSSKVP
jgi:hypothetical protein